MRSPTAPRRALAGAALLIVLAGCSSDPYSGGASTTTGAPTSTSARSVVAASLRGKRYCEVLLVRLIGDGARADVYNSYPLNACPQAQWTKLDAAAVAKANGFPVAVLNGPRYWLMDRIAQTQSKLPPKKTFGGIEMYRRASVDVGPIADARKPYVLHAVNRATVFTFDTGRTIYELRAPDGRVFVMQSWSQDVDPTLTQADLVGLGTRLQLPTGWTYRSRTLTSPLRVVTTATTAKVMQDELHDSYSLETGG